MNSSINPSVAVLLLNYNQWQMTLECVQSVLKSDYQNFRIFLIDNGSRSLDDYNSLISLKSEKCDVIRSEKNMGYVGGMNFGLEWATTQGFELFLVMNNDAVIAPDAISELVRCSQKYNYKCIVTGKVYWYDRTNLIQHIGSKFVNKKTLELRRMVVDQEDLGQWDKEMEMDMIDDIFWLYPNAIYKEVGGYSPCFWFNAEQADLALRAVAAGNRLIYTPKARLWHKGSLSIGGRRDNPRFVFYDVQANLLFKFIHLSAIRFLYYYLGAIFIVLKGYAKHFIKVMLKRNSNRLLIDAQMKAIHWFNVWLFKRNANDGSTPFDEE